MWCCDASKFTAHENRQTSNLNIKYSGEHNKRDVQIKGRHSQPTGNDNKKRYAPRCQLLHHQIKAVKEPPSPLQTTVSYGIILSHGQKSTATSAKRQFNTSNYYVHTKLKIHVPVVPLVETQLIKCLQAEQITLFLLLEGLNSCITCQIHYLFALLAAAAVLTIFTVTGVPFSE